jgi:hypothetical protein
MPPTEAALLFGDFFDPARKKQPSLGILAKRYPALSNSSLGLLQFVSGLLSALVCGEHLRLP